MSATPDSTFTNPEQLIADLQRQLVECKAERDEAQRKLNETTTERDEALARGAATAEVLRVINSSPGELAPVFEAVLQSAVRICEANFGTLYLRETDAFRAVAMHNAPPAYAEARTRALLQPPPDAPLGRVAITKQVAHIADIRTNRSYVERHPFVIDAAELGNFRTVLSVPMLRDDALIGAININRQEVRPFTDKQIELVRTFADQAVIAIENGRLLTETREALEQQTATAEVLQVINSSPGDLSPVFEAMLEKAARLCEAPFGNLRTWDGERFHFGAVYGDPQFSDWVRERGPVRPDRDDDSPLGQIIKGERIVRFTVAPGNEGYWTSAGFMEMVAVSGMRSGITVALTKDETLLGTISVYRQELRPFSDKQISLLQNFATQAVIAMENARLLGELRTRTNDLEESLEYQTAMGDVLKIISRTDAKIDAVLDTLVRRASHICEADQAVLHQLRDGLHYVVASFGFTPEYEEYVARNPIKPGRGTAIGRMSLESRVIHIHDVLQDTEYTGSEFQRLAGFRTLLAVPLLREDTVIGSLLLSRLKVEPFTEKQIELVRTFADQAAIAIENARLLGELRQRTDQVAELNRGLEARVTEQVEELGRVGRLKRFLAPQLAELIVSRGDEKILESHRREIVVVFCDLRGYTAFTETAEPEEVLDFLREYHGALGPLVSQYEGTLDQFSGDGIMVFFNDPVPCPDPAERAVKMATAMREAAGTLIASWRRRGRLLGFGAGIAQGYATLGQIGFAERSGYTAIGTVCNLAARLCAEAQDGQILIGQRVAIGVEETITLEEVGALTLKGLTQPVVAYNVPLAAIQPALRVIEGGPQSV
jgi:GAF domain-containing protein